MAKEKLIIELVAEAKGAIKNLQAYTKEAKKTSDRVGKLTKLFKSYFAEIAGGILIARKLVKTAGELVKEFSKFDQIEMAFQNMSKAAGVSSEAVIDSMKELSGSTISTLNLMQSANKAMLLGIPIDELDQMMEIARAAAQATGETVKKMFDDIVVGVGRQSRMILDNLGIIVSVEKANEDYAEAVGIVGRELNETEKRQAFLNATLAAGQDIIQKVGIQAATDAEKYQQMSAAVANLRVEMGRTINDAIQPMLPLAINIVTRLNEWVKAKNDLRDAYALIKKPMEVTNLNMEMEIALATQLTAAHQLKRKEIELDAAIRSVMQHGSQEYIDTLKEEIATLYQDIAAVNIAIPLIQQAIAVKEKQVVVIDNTIERIEDETDVVIESSDAWTRWAETMKHATDEAINTKAAIDVLTDSTFDAFHAAEIYSNSLRTDVIPAMEELALSAQESAQLFFTAWDNAYSSLTAVFAQYYKNQLLMAEGNEEKQKEILREQARVAKALGIFEAVVNTARAVALAYATYPWPWSIAVASLMAGLGAAQIALIASQPLPMQQGGEVKHLQTGGFGDTVPAMLEPGEVVIDKFTAQRNAPAIGAMRGGEGGGDRNVNLVLDGKVLARWIWKESTNKNVTISARGVI